MAEELLRKHCGNCVEVESAGLSPGTLNPMAVEVLREVNIDIRNKQTRSIDSVLHSGRAFDHVITVCDEASAERCPAVPGRGKRLHWSLEDPSQFTGTWEEKLGKTRTVREQINSRVQEWCDKYCNT